MTTERRSLATMPLSRGRVLLPRHDRRAAAAGVALAGASRLSVLRTHRLLAGVVGSVGARWLPPARGQVWPRWVSPEATDALVEELATAVDRFDAVAVARSRRLGQPSFALLLLRSGEPVAFVKVKREDTDLIQESAVLDALGRRPGPVRIPRPLHLGATAGLHWLATTPLPPGLHRPATVDPGPELEPWLRTCLDPLIPRSANPGWGACHGDLAPWNLRRCGSDTWLLDWESVTAAPPEADLTYFRATATAVLGAPVRPAPDEAIDFWRQQLRARGDEDPKLNRRLLAVLEEMGSGSARCLD